MPLDPDRPHGFRPLVILRPEHSDYRQRKRIREWTVFNRSILPADLPCTVCGGSDSLPVHHDPEWTR